AGVGGDAGASQDDDAAGRVDPAAHPPDDRLQVALAHRPDTLHSLRGRAPRSPARRSAAARGVLAEGGRRRLADRDGDDAGHRDARRPRRRSHGDLPRRRCPRGLARLLYRPREQQGTRSRESPPGRARLPLGGPRAPGARGRPGDAGARRRLRSLLGHASARRAGGRGGQPAGAPARARRRGVDGRSVARHALDAMTLPIAEHVPLGPLTTLGVGGAARWFVEAADEAAVRAAHAWARERHVPLRVLGGGSNLVVADAGVDALVVRIALRGLSHRERGGAVELTAAAGEPWDGIVASSVERGWAGLECLSGIPGLVGATPIQNVGAYGQEVSDTVIAVRALDTTTGEVAEIAAADCGFAYRDSVFKRETPGRFVVLAVTYRLRPGGAPTLTYADVQRHLADRGATLADTRAAVLTIRRGKSMVLDDPADPNRR